MKIDDDMRFPHPVLWAQTADYSNGEFGISLQVAEIPATGAVKAKCDVTLTEADVAALLASGQAQMGLSIVCLDTYYNNLIRIPHQGGEFEIPPGRLRGQVTFRPMIWATTKVESFVSSNIHQEFGNDPVTFGSADILALGEQILINVGSDKLAPIASVFELALNADVAPDRVAIELDEERVQILACQTTLEKIYLLRNTTEGRALLLNSVYLPVVMEVISAMRDGDDVYEGKRWHRVFSAKLDHLGISASTEILDAAQTLLKSPFGRLEATHV